MSECIDLNTSDSEPEIEVPKVKRRLLKKPEPNLDDTLLEENNEKSPTENKKNHKIAYPVLNPFAFIKNKDIRIQQYKKIKAEKNKLKRAEKKVRKLEGGPKNQGHTIESLREENQTIVKNIEDSDNEELRKDIETDDFNAYYAKSYAPKVLISYSDNPSSKTRTFGQELCHIIPNSLARTRNWSSIKKMCASAIRNEYTDLIVINQNRQRPNGMLIIHLPNGPTAHFKLSGLKVAKELKRDYKEMSSHRPEVILNNFSTRLGLNIGRMFGALFHQDPEFKGRRVVTFHNQRDYIFFRHHRYEFTKEGKRAKLRELGPRFTLKLRSLQEGLFDSKCGDYEWLITNQRHAMEARRRFFL